MFDIRWLKHSKNLWTTWNSTGFFSIQDTQTLRYVVDITTTTTTDTEEEDKNQNNAKPFSLWKSKSSKKLIRIDYSYEINNFSVNRLNVESVSVRSWICYLPIHLSGCEKIRHNRMTVALCSQGAMSYIYTLTTSDWLC